MRQFFRTIQQALSSTKSMFTSRIKALFGKPWDDTTYEALEQILYESDLGSSCTEKMLDHIKKTFRLSPPKNFDEILSCLRQYTELVLSLPSKSNPKPNLPTTPRVFLIVGINGSGKTTSIAKLAYHFQNQGKKVLIGACDTFRAAAIDQLQLWADKLHVDIVTSKIGADPSAVAFDTISAGKSRGAEVILLDTAGRLQNKTDLMHELEKIQRICAKQIPEAPHETFFVLDATSGQNALDQAEIFHKMVPLTGIIVSKLDGSAKAGVILSIYEKLQIPPVFIGTGESYEDLSVFDKTSFSNGLF